jgi:hypothetical protein
MPKKVTDEEMNRRAQENQGRLADTMTDYGVAALSAVILDDTLDYGKVLEGLQFMRKIKFNRNFDLVSRHDIDRHFARHGIETEYGDGNVC